MQFHFQAYQNKTMKRKWNYFGTQKKFSFSFCVVFARQMKLILTLLLHQLVFMLYVPYFLPIAVENKTQLCKISLSVLCFLLCSLACYVTDKIISSHYFSFDSYVSCCWYDDISTRRMEQTVATLVWSRSYG